MQQALAVITPHEDTLNIKSEKTNHKQNEGDTGTTAVKVHSGKAVGFEPSLNIPQHQGFSPKQEELGLAETDEPIPATQIIPNTTPTSVLEHAEKIPNQQGIDQLESTEERVQEKVEKISLKLTQKGEPAISMKSPKSTGFVPELLSTTQVPSAEEKPQQPSISTETHNVRLKSLPEQISKPLGEHSKIEYSKALDSSITKVTPATEEHGHGKLEIPTCIEKFEGYEPLEESAPVNEEILSENVQFASKSEMKTSAKELAKCIEKVRGHFDENDQTSDIPEIASSESNFTRVIEKNVSPPSEARNVDNSGGFLPLHESIGVINKMESVNKEAIPLIPSLPERAIQTANIQGQSQTSYEAKGSDKTEDLTALSELAKIASVKSSAHQFATFVEKTTGHGEGHGLIQKLSSETDLKAASEKSVTPPREAANVEKHEGFVPIEEKVDTMALSETPSARANPQAADALHRALKKASQEGYLGISEDLGEISSSVLPSNAYESVLSPTKDISQVLQAGFLPVQEKVDDHRQDKPYEYEDAKILKEKSRGQMMATSHSLTGGITIIEENVEEQADVLAGHLHSSPSITSVPDADIAVKQDLLVGSHAQTVQQTKDYYNADARKGEQIMPTNIANEKAICASQEEVKICHCLVSLLVHQRPFIR